MSTPERFLKISEVVAMFGRTRSIIYADIKKGNFPMPVHIGGSARWPLSEMEIFAKELMKKDRTMLASNNPKGYRGEKK